MFDLTNITSQKGAKIRFTRKSSNLWEVKVFGTKHGEGDICQDYMLWGRYDEATDACIPFPCLDNWTGVDVSDEDIKAAFETFSLECPESIVGDLIPTHMLSEQSSIDDNIYVFEKLLVGASMLAYGEDTGIKYATRCINWLRSTDFYNAPASTRYHDAYVGGLLTHTLKVVNNVVQLMKLPQFALNVNIAEATLAALAHDWCKIDRYEQYMRNVKNESTGVWEKVPSFRYKDSPVPFGHGTASMFIAQKFFKLSTEQALAIRWHMGRWYVCESDMNDLQYSNENYPLVHLIQFADQLAIVNY